MDDKRLPLVASTGNLDNAPTMVTRAALTLWCQYYLEGGWGWVVLSASVVSTLLTFGCQWTIVDYLSRTAISDWKFSTLQKVKRDGRLIYNCRPDSSSQH
uniref:Uncharacterized protein n=1 Tax=Daphnia galeata TaxID=27404 RepID=A0A8J2S7E0_9CRUS|nr:unnamed protein product [Daphnia galeata]